MGSFRSDYRYNLMYDKETGTFRGNVIYFYSDENTPSTENDGDRTSEITFNIHDLFKAYLSGKEVTSLVIDGKEYVDERQRRL